MAEEAPQAYKEIDEVVHVTEKAGISDRVTRLTPIAVMKG
jgi:tRNA-splicing ligase RtcB